MAKPNRKCFKPIVKPLTTTEMIALIQNGESQENYATWAKSAPQAVRLALAENKYELDRLSKDEDPVIVVTVMKKSKEHLRKIMQSALKIELVRSAISYDVTIDKDILESEASPPKLRLDGASAVRFRGFSFFLRTDFLLSLYDLSLSSSRYSC